MERYSPNLAIVWDVKSWHRVRGRVDSAHRRSADPPKHLRRGLRRCHPNGASDVQRESLRRVQGARRREPGSIASDTNRMRLHPQKHGVRIVPWHAAETAQPSFLQIKRYLTGGTTAVRVDRPVEAVASTASLAWSHQHVQTDGHVRSTVCGRGSEDASRVVSFRACASLSHPLAARKEL